MPDRQHPAGGAAQGDQGHCQDVEVIGIEDLNVRGMMANGNLARAVGDVGLFEFRRQLGYKAAMRGVRILVEGRWYPSSRRCSDGKIYAGRTLSDRT